MHLGNRDKISRAVCGAVLSGLVLTSLCAPGNIITYEGIGPGNEYGSSGNWFGHYSVSDSMTVAQQFTATVGGSLEEIYALIEPDSYTLDRSYTLRLLADQSNSPGTILWSTTSQTWPVPDDALFHLANIGGPLLTAGQTYWIQADKPVVIGSAHNWSINTAGYRGTLALSTDEGPWEIYPDVTVRGLRILVIPEPGTASLLLISLGLLGCLLRRSTRIH